MALALGLAAPAAEAAGSVRVSVSTSGDPRGVQLTVSPIGAGAALDTTVAGTPDGVLTVSDPGGVELFAVSGAPCSAVSPTTVTCGVAGDPATYLTVNGGAQDDSVDLTGLATQATSRPGLATSPAAFPAAFDVDQRMGGIFANVLTAGGADEIDGGGAGAVYAPGDGDDTVRGGSGDEVFRASAESTDGSDTFAGGGGYDTMSYSQRAGAVSGSLGDGATSGLGSVGENDSVEGVEALVGGRGPDTLSITGALGGLGTLAGAAGDDTLTGGPSTDKLTGGSGRDELFGGEGDDQLTDPGVDQAFAGSQPPNLPGHLNGGGGDDELFQRSDASAFTPFADGAPTCGAGTDVLRADPGVDEGVGLFAGPDDCELLATVGDGTFSVVSGELRVGQTVTISPASGLRGTPVSGRLGATTWEICSAGNATCEQRKTAGPQLTFGPADVGRELLFATVRLVEPLSQAPRWVEERRITELRVGASSLLARPAGSGAILGIAAPVVPDVGRAPVPLSAPDASAALRSLKTAFGAKPKLSLLGKTTSIRFTATAGARVTVQLSLTKGKRTTLLSRGAATADATGKVSLALRPTKAGKKARKAAKKLKVAMNITVESATGKATATGTLPSLRR